jgi:hypothetical protein
MQVGERRAKFREGLSSLYLPKYDALCAKMGTRWAPYYGVRSFEQQTALFGQGRTIAPIGQSHIVTWARAGESPHNYGCASDWTLWDDQDRPIWMELADPRWAEYRDACRELGLRWGGTFHVSPDFPHNELLITADWKHILIAYKQGGMTAAQNHIAENLR